MEIISFLNSHSGTIYIGVDNNGEVIGVDDYDRISLKIDDRIYTNIQPSTEGLVEINTLDIDNKLIIVANGIEKPYYIKKLGMLASGCTIRIGTRTISMTQHQIDRLYSMRVKHTLSTMLWTKQNLTLRN